MVNSLIRNIICAGTAVILLSCSGQDVSEIGQVSLQVEATIANDNTRLNSDGLDEDDEIGISSSDNLKTNLKYAMKDGQIVPSMLDDTYYFPNADFVTFSAYYPYSKLDEDKETFSIDVATNQTSSSIDVLFAQGRASLIMPKASFTFRHALSRITFNIVDRGGFDEISDVSLQVVGLQSRGDFNVRTGSIACDDSSVADIPASLSSDRNSAQVIVLPQTLATGFSVRLVVNNVDYTATINLTTIEPGNNYIFPLTVTKRSFSVGKVTIADLTDVNYGQTYMYK
jgi:hypothetical protein